MSNVEALFLLADHHPVPAVAAQLRERALDIREEQREAGEDALAAIREIATILAKVDNSDTKKTLLVALGEIESICGEFDV